MTYKFVDFGQKAESTPLSIRSIIRGNEMETYLKTDEFSFTTLSVSGRGSTSYSPDIIEIPNRHGGLFRETRLDSRTIVIRALVRATTNEAYREGMSKLNAYFLDLTNVSLRFTDDPAHTYYGVPIRVEDEGEQSNRQIVELEFLCADPFKYTATKEITYSTATKLELDTDIKILADVIELTFASTAEASDFTLTNNTTGKSIVFKGTAVSPVIQIKQRYDFIGSANGSNKINGLQIKYSDFDDLTIKKGDVLWASPAPQQIKITYRGAKL